MEGISKGRRGRRRGKVGQNFVIERTKARDGFVNERTDEGRGRTYYPPLAACNFWNHSGEGRELVAPLLSKFLGQWMRQWNANISTLMLSHW